MNKYLNLLENLLVILGIFIFFYIPISIGIHYHYNSHKYVSGEKIEKKRDRYIYYNFIVCILIIFIIFLFFYFNLIYNYKLNPVVHIFFIILLLSQFIILILELTLNIIQKKNNKTLRKSFDIMSTIYVALYIIILLFFSSLADSSFQISKF